MSPTFYRTRLLEELGQRQRKNPAYSLRAFAKALGLQPPTLSAVLAGKRGLPRRQAQVLAQRLGLKPLERLRFVESVRGEEGIAQSRAGSKPTHALTEEQHYRILAEWEHYAVLTLMKVRGFRSDPKWIAGRLGIAVFRVREVLERLEASALIRRAPAGYERMVGDLRTSEDVRSAALRDAHDDELRLAALKQRSTPTPTRDFSSVSFVTSPDRVADAKALIREFRARFSDLVETPDGTEVYQLCLQFFPLTELNREKDLE
jgi:uncharacterized protein (TIGR02147 family)